MMLRSGGKLAALAALLLVAVGAVASESPAADRLVVYKSQRKLVVLVQGHVYRTYRVALGKSPHGAKLCRGDNRTPEGAYFVTRRVPESHYYLALHLSYPSPEDVSHAMDSGCDPGGDIEIHGLTRGCGRCAAGRCAALPRAAGRRAMSASSGRGSSSRETLRCGTGRCS